MKNNRKRLLVIFVPVLFIIAILLTVLACDPGFDLIVVNGADQALTIYIVAGRPKVESEPKLPSYSFSLKPGERFKASGIWVIYNYYTIIAKNDKGETVYSREFDYDELRDAKFEVVIKAPQDK